MPIADCSRWKVEYLLTKENEVEDVGHQKLRIYQIAHDLASEIHRMSLQLPKFELYEEGSQIRRSSKSVASCIVEGFAVRRYKAEYVHYLFRAYGSARETIEHLDFLWQTGSLTDQAVYQQFRERCEALNGMLYRFIQGVQREHDFPDSLREPSAGYYVDDEDPLSEERNDPETLTN